MTGEVVLVHDDRKVTIRLPNAVVMSVAAA